MYNKGRCVECPGRRLCHGNNTDDVLAKSFCILSFHKVCQGKEMNVFAKLFAGLSCKWLVSNEMDICVWWILFIYMCMELELYELAWDSCEAESLF